MTVYIDEGVRNCVYELLMYVIFVVRRRTGMIIGMILLAFP